MVMDFADLETIVRSEVLDRLDHQYLNDIIDNPTCERVVAWIWTALSRALPLLNRIRLWETDTACAELTLEDKCPDVHFVRRILEISQ